MNTKETQTPKFSMSQHFADVFLDRRSEKNRSPTETLQRRLNALDLTLIGTLIKPWDGWEEQNNIQC